MLPRSLKHIFLLGCSINSARRPRRSSEAPACLRRLGSIRRHLSNACSISYSRCRFSVLLETSHHFFPRLRPGIPLFPSPVPSLHDRGPSEQLSVSQQQRLRLLSSAPVPTCPLLLSYSVICSCSSATATEPNEAKSWSQRIPAAVRRLSVPCSASCLCFLVDQGMP